MRHQKVKRVLWSAGGSLFVIFISAISHAQDATEALTLKQAIDSALANNREIRLAISDEKIAASQFRETNAVFLPQVDLSFTALTTNNPLNAFGFKMQQQSVKETDFIPDRLNHPGQSADFMSAIRVNQPILNLDHLYLRKAAAAQTELYRWKTDRLKQYFVFEVTKAYMQLRLAWQAESVFAEALRTANESYRFTSDRVTEGLLQQSDALNMKVRVATVEAGLAEAKSNTRNASDYLSLLMGSSYGKLYTVEKDIQPATAAYPDSIPSDRADFMAMRKAIQATELSIRSSKMSYLPRVNAFASYQLNDNRLAGFAADSYLAGVQLTWNIFRGTSTKNKIATQELEREQLAKKLDKSFDENELELNKTKRQLSDAGYKISQQGSAVKSAEESLRILNDRYEQGLATSADLLQAQTQLSQLRLSLAQAYFERDTTIAYLHFLTDHNP